MLSLPRRCLDQVAPVDDTDDKKVPPDGAAGARKIQPPAPALPPPMVMSGMPGGGMGYPGYPSASGFGFPPQAQAMMPFFPGAGGFPPMMAPPQTFGYAAASGVSVPSSTKASGTQICTIWPPGMPRAFDVPYPERKLPVCVRCKKNYRSRELCRQRDQHKALPWQTTYVVVTLTDEVLVKVEDGSLTCADIPVVAELQEMPELCRGPAGGYMQKEPICKVCKEKNYTRDYCRNTSRHTTPPYQTVYVKLVPKTSENDERPMKKKKRRPEENADGKPRPDPDNPDLEVDNSESDDLNDIHKSRTFFAAVSAKKITVKWCEQIHYPPATENPSQSGAPMMPPHMGNTLNVGMQGQLWDAFRAGAMWAQSQGSQMPPPMAYGHPDAAAYAPNPSAKS